MTRNQTLHRRDLNRTVLLTLVALQPACGSDHTHVLLPADAPTVLVGTASIALTVDAGLTVDALSYSVTTRDDAPVAAGSVDLRREETSLLLRLGLPASADYRIHVYGEASGGRQCEGEATFSVHGGRSTTVFVDVVCSAGGPPVTTGSALVVGRVRASTETACATVSSYSASPARARVGDSLGLRATAPAGRGVQWQAPSGSVAQPTALETSFRCTAPGVVPINVSLTGSDACSGSQVLEVTCVGEGPAELRDRLVIADATLPVVRVLDPSTGAVLASFEVGSPAGELYTTESGRFVAVVQSAANRVDFIDTGLEVEDHGDHVHHNLLPPRRSALSLSGVALGTVGPVHFVSHHGWVTQHFDGFFDGAAPVSSIPAKNVVFAEAELLSPTPTSTLVLQSAPQHGVSVAAEGGYLIFSQPSSDRARSALPSGFGIHRLADGVLVQTLHDTDSFESSCWGMHGEAVVGGSALFGCHESLDGGILVIDWDSAAGTFVSRKIEYPGYPTATARTSVIQAHPASPWAVGQWGSFPGVNQYRGLVRIDPQAHALTESDTLDLGAVYCSFGFEQARGQKLAALTQSGMLHIIDVADWRVESALPLLPDTSAEARCPGELAVGDGVAYVSDAGTATMRVVSLEDASLGGTFAVPGAPGAIVAASFRGPVAAQ